LVKEEEYILILQKLGLSFTQAKIWLTIVQLEEANVTAIAKNAKIDRSECSQSIKKLHELGLVDELISFPKRFRITTAQDSLSMLLLSKEKEYKTLRRGVRSLVQNINCIKSPREETNQENQITFLDNIKKINIIQSKLIKEAKKSFDLSGDWQGFRSGINIEADALREIGKRVKFRVVITKPDNETALSEIIQFLKKRPNAKLKFTDKSEPPIFLVIIDGTRVIIPTVTQRKFRINEGNVSPRVFTNADPFIQLSQSYFEHIWSIARPIELTELIPSSSQFSDMPPKGQK
jgi:sugar-specific transcriptional regulator TrmB